MDLNNFDYPHSAITTWNGFLYQGQLAILHVIKLLIESYNIDYSLQLDSLEDFAIVEENEDTMKSISLHQVKGLKSTTYGSYTNAFDKLNAKSDMCSNLYFHVARKFTNITVEQIEKDYSNIKIYEYSDGKHYCGLSDVNNQIEFECKQLYGKHFKDATYKQDGEYITQTIHYLTSIIMQAVSEVHNDTHLGLALDDELAYEKVIPFDMFREVFGSNLNEIGDKTDYYRMIALEDFQRYYEGFCYEYSTQISEEEKSKIFEYVDIIMKFDNKELEILIKGIAPHREFKFNTVQDYKDDGLQKDEMEQVFFFMLKDIRKGDFENNQIQWKCKQKNCYRPTSISAPVRVKENICARIIQNCIDTDVLLLFEGGTLITEYLQSKSVLNDALNLINIDVYNESHILNAKSIKLERVESAKEILNDSES